MKMMRAGDKPKLDATEEEALLEKLRREREAKAHTAMMAEVHTLSAKMVELELKDCVAEAAKLSKSEKALAVASDEAQIALVLNAIMRSCNPPAKDDKSKKGGGGKKQNAIKAAAAKVVEGEPPAAAAVRKALKANKHLLGEVTKKMGEKGQVALLQALQAWALSPQGAVALEKVAKIIEVLYDVDLAEEAVLKAYWADVQAQRVREKADLAAAEVAFTATSAERGVAEEAVKVAEKEKADAAWYLKRAEENAQACRCGGNPNKEEEAAEKAAQNNLKKCVDYHGQTTKVLVARSKDLVEARAEAEPAKRLLDDLRHRQEVGVELFSKHATPFFDWLEAEEESDDEAAEIS